MKGFCIILSIVSLVWATGCSSARGGRAGQDTSGTEHGRATSADPGPQAIGGSGSINTGKTGGQDGF